MCRCRRLLWGGYALTRVNGETYGAEEVAMQSNLSLVRESLAREVWLATIMVRRPWRGRQTARELSLTWRMLQKNDIRERLPKRPVGVDTASSRADSHNFLPVRRSGLSEPRSRYAVLLHLEVQGLVVGSEVSGRCAPVSPGGLEPLTDRLPLGIRRGRLTDLL